MIPAVVSGRFFKKSKQIKSTADHAIEACSHSVDGKYIHHKPTRAIEGKNTYLKVGKAGIKEVIIPDREPTEEPAILPLSEFHRLEKQAKVLTQAEKKAMFEEAERQKNQIAQESNQRKEQLLKTRKIQQALPGSKLETEETEAAKKNLYLIRRSKELQIEQDDRVKQCNRMILATKCRAIRNAQLAEKKLIEEEIKAENMRLDMLMEQTRQTQAQIEEKRRAEAEERRQKYIKEIEEQMREKEMQELVEAEKQEEERKMINKALIEVQKEEAEKAEKKKKLKVTLRNEFMKATEDQHFFNTLREEEDKMIEMRIKEFQRIKEERKAAQEKEKKEILAAREREAQRLMEGHSKSADIKELMESLKATRAQEEKEKEWREKEKKEAEKRKASLEDLKRSRAQQIEDIRKAQAIALQRDEEDFMKVATLQRKLHEKHLALEEKRKEDKEKHRRYLLRQINEKEKDRINFQMEKFEDGKAQRQEFAVKDRSIDEYLDEKVQKLRHLNVPENYIRDIERQMQNIKN